jgi:hypothetical protein
MEITLIWDYVKGKVLISICNETCASSKKRNKICESCIQSKYALETELSFIRTDSGSVSRVKEVKNWWKYNVKNWHN